MLEPHASDEFGTLRTEIEERLTALIDSHYHGGEASKLCRTAADREFTKQVMDDLKKQIRSLRAKLRALGADGRLPRLFVPLSPRRKVS